MSNIKYDHIVIGGGAAGCVAAARLASEGSAKVLLLEAGYSHHHPLLDMPPGIFKMINGSKFMTYHKTVPQEHLDGRVHDIPQGHVLGGGSSVNAQVYMRGRPSDYDEWHEILGNDDNAASWDWDSVLPHFVRMEDNNRLYNSRHGFGGPMKVSDPGHINEMSRWFVQSMQSIGVPYNADFNGETQTGVGFYQFMNRNGKRSSSAYAFVEPQKKNKNLEVILEAKVQKIIIENGRATGVQYKDKSGTLHTVTSDKDIVVSAGAMVTPQILMLSGIGPAAHLKEHGIDVEIDLPGVGNNFIDHPEVPMVANANGPYGYYKQGDGWRMLKNGIQFKLFGSGPVTSAGVEAGAFVNPVDENAPPSVQAFCVPTVYVDRDTLGLVEDSYGITVTTVVVKPKSRGTVTLQSSSPDDMPVICPNLLKDKEDLDMMVAAQRFFLKAFQSGPLAEKISAIAIPSPNDLSDEALETHCKRFVKTNYHPAGTACMGSDSDPMAVLDSRMKVRGIENLRVCDMSAVPNINAGNTNAPAMMLGDRCADFIMGKL